MSENENGDLRDKPWYGSLTELKRIIMLDNHTTDPKRVDEFVDELIDLDPFLQPHFLRWAKTGEVPTVEVRDFSIQRVQELQPGFNVTGAFGMLNHLIKDYESARELVWDTPVMALAGQYKLRKGDNAFDDRGDQMPEVISNYFLPEWINLFQALNITLRFDKSCVQYLAGLALGSSGLRPITHALRDLIQPHLLNHHSLSQEVTLIFRDTPKPEFAIRSLGKHSRPKQPPKTPNHPGKPKHKHTAIELLPDRPKNGKAVNSQRPSHSGNRATTNVPTKNYAESRESQVELDAKLSALRPELLRCEHDFKRNPTQETLDAWQANIRRAENILAGTKGVQH